MLRKNTGNPIRKGEELEPMNCRYCGNELNPDARNCPHCGFDTNANDLKSILREIIRLDGEEKLLDGQGLLNLLADVAPELRKERNLLSYLVNSHGNEAILEGSKAGEDALQNAVQTTARQIAEDYSADPAKALEICEVFASALAPGWHPETDARESSAPKDPVRPHNEEGDTDGNALRSRHDKALNSGDTDPVPAKAGSQNADAPRSPRVKISRPMLIAAAAVLIVLLLMVAVLPRSCGGDPTPSPPPTPSPAVSVPPSPSPAPTKTLPISGTCGKALSWTIDETGVLTISGTGPMENYRVELAESPFTKNSEFIQSAVLEPGVTSIGEGAFFNCSNMRSITLPDTLTSIGSSAFSTCEALTEIDLPGSIKEIGNGAFSCSGLRSIVIPEQVTSIKVGTFTSCKDLSSITLPTGFKEIEAFSLGGCDALKDIYYPGTEQQFRDNVQINATLPDGITIHTSNQTAAQPPISSPSNADVATSSPADNVPLPSKPTEVSSTTEPLPLSTSATIPINNEFFPDEVFRDYVSKWPVDKNGDGVLTAEERERVDYISLYNPSKIWSLKGIEWFPNLVQLYLGGSDEIPLKELDVSHNTNLTLLNCSNCQLTTLDLTNNKKLKNLYCSGNKLSKLDISHNTELARLSCSGNLLSQLDISNNRKLEELYCTNNKLSSLDVSNNSLLKDLRCDHNAISSLNLRKNSELQTLWCNSNNLRSLDLGQNRSLKHLQCGSNQITELDLHLNTDLYYIYCGYQPLSKLNITGLSKLEYLSCSSDALDILDISGCTLLIDAYQNGTTNSNSTDTLHHYYKSQKGSFSIRPTTVVIK